MPAPAPPPSRSRSRSVGFTLIELLVVISIIALLIGILLPALGAARRTARALACATQMQQLGRAIAVYQNDFDSHFPTLIRTPDNTQITWDDLLGGGYDGRSLKEADMIGAEDSESAYALYRCPLDENRRANVGANEGAARTYSMNQMNLRPGFVPNTLRGVAGFDKDGNAASRRIEEVSSGSNTIVLDEILGLDPATGLASNTLGSGFMVGGWPLEHDSRFTTPISKNLGHHGSGGDNSAAVVSSSFSPNYLFADSHVAATPNMDTYRQGGASAPLAGSFDVRRTMWDAVK